MQKTPRTTPGDPAPSTPPAPRRPLPTGTGRSPPLLAANLGPTPRTRRRRAEKAGRDWATSLILATSTTNPDETAHRIVDLFAEMNFDPELADPAPGTGEREIRLRACPYRDVAREHPDVVCAIHLGLLQGALTQLGNPPTTVRLVPFVKPHLCLAYLTPGGHRGPVDDRTDQCLSDDNTRAGHRRGHRVRLARHGAGHLLPGNTPEIPGARDHPAPRPGHRPARLPRPEHHRNYLGGSASRRAAHLPARGRRLGPARHHRSTAGHPDRATAATTGPTRRADHDRADPTPSPGCIWPTSPWKSSRSRRWSHWAPC